MGEYSYIADLAGFLFSVYESFDIQMRIQNLYVTVSTPVGGVLLPICTKAAQLLHTYKNRHFTGACGYLIIASKASTNVLILVAQR
jgi:hypothetical protein